MERMRTGGGGGKIRGGKGDTFSRSGAGEGRGKRQATLEGSRFVRGDQGLQDSCAV